MLAETPAARAAGPAARPAADGTVAFRPLGPAPGRAAVLLVPSHAGGSGCTPVAPQRT
ncbi:hypothetical protein [Streptomyces sp. NPDC007083]|uniref:hypothetical protein n=1 Tax=unclassified Streptomyces TaxID=2593676 RepID=UPI00340660B4